MPDASGNSFRIILDEERSFFPGDVLKGHLSLPFVELDTVSSIPLELSVRSTALSRLEEDPSNDSKDNVTSSRLSRHIIHYESKHMWSSKWKGRPATKSEDCLTFPFQITIPSEIPYATNGKSSGLPMPPSFYKDDRQHLAGVEYLITATVVFTDPKKAQLQDHKSLTVKMKPRTRAELEEFVEMIPRDSILLTRPGSGGIFRKTFSRRKSHDDSFRFKVVIIRPKYLRYNHRFFFKALVLTERPPSYFASEDPSNKSVRRGESSGRGSIYLRRIDSSIVSYTNVKADDYEASMYSTSHVFSQATSIALDMSKLVPFNQESLPAPVSRPTKYMLDITSLLPAMSIPHVAASFQTDNVKQVHLLKMSMVFSSSYLGKDTEVTESQDIIQVVTPGMDKS